MKQLKRADYYHDNHYITKEVRDLAYEDHKVTGRTVDEILIAYGFITEHDRVIAESLEKKIPYVDLIHEAPGADALALLDKSIAMKRRILPFACDEKSLTVVVESDHDFRSATLLERMTLREIRYAYAESNRITESLKYLYEGKYHAQKEHIHSLVIGQETVDVTVLFEALMHVAIDLNASDIHIAPEEDVVNVFVRLDGVLQHYCSLPVAIKEQLISRIKVVCKLDIAQKRISQDGSMSMRYAEKSYDFRISTMPTDLGESVVLRILSNDKELFTIDQLGLNESNLRKIKQLAKKPHGVILMSGPTGSGKTTTLYAILREVNRLQKNVLTIENPIEYRIPFVKQTQYNPKAGYTYDKAIRAFMRQDPDIILVGEIRDPDTAQIAMEASITGHLVLSTVHTNDSIGALIRLRGLKVPSFLLSEGILAVVSQRLVRKLCPYCKSERSYAREELLHTNLDRSLIKADAYTFYEPVGCNRCNNTGYFGRIAVVELFQVDTAIKTMIFEESNTVDILQHAIAQGMIPLQEDLFRKIEAGITSVEEYERTIL